MKNENVFEKGGGQVPAQPNSRNLFPVRTPRETAVRKRAATQ
jgi:hypothetical protein